VQTLTSLALVLVQRIGVDLGVASVVDVLRHGVPGTTSHGAKDDQRRGNSSDDDTSHDNTGDDSKESEASLLDSFAFIQNLRAVGKRARGVGRIREAVVWLGGTALHVGLVAVRDPAEQVRAIHAVLGGGDASERDVTDRIQDARRGR